MVKYKNMETVVWLDIKYRENNGRTVILDIGFV